MRTRLAIKVVPGASESGIAGWLGKELKIRVSAAPEKGKANQAVVKLLSLKLGLPANRVKIISGHAQARKRVEISGLDPDQLERALGIPEPQKPRT